MPRLHRPRDGRWVMVWTIALLTLSGTPGAAVPPEDTWKACQDRVIADLEAAGRHDYGAVSADTGATGAGALDAVIERCGYHPAAVDRTLCDDLYRQVYQACREDGFEGLSTAAAAWVLIFDPGGPLVARLRRVCAQSTPLSRAAFGRLVCVK